MSESNIKQLYSNSLLQQYKTAHSVCMAPVVITTTVFAMRDTLGCTVIPVSYNYNMHHKLFLLYS